MECSFLKEVTAECEREHSDNLKSRGWDGQHVGVKTREPDAAKSKSQVSLNWRSGNVTNQSDEIQAPHRGVPERILDVFECCGLIDKS